MLHSWKTSVEGVHYNIEKISPEIEIRNKKIDKSKEKVRKYLVFTPKYLVSEQ